MKDDTKFGGHGQQKGHEPIQEQKKQAIKDVNEIKENIRNLSSFAKLGAGDLIKYAETISKGVSGDISKTQIRRIFSAVKKIQMEVRREDFNKQKDKIILLKPKLAYAAKKKSEVKDLAEILSECIDRIKSKEDFERFVDFFEAIVAYHGE